MKVLIARMCFGSVERSEVGSWLVRCYREAFEHPELDVELNDMVVDCAGTHVARNRAVDRARTLGFDVLFMVDHDNDPHRDWFAFACKFLKEHPAAVLASPYCGSSPLRPGDPDRRVNVTIRDEGATCGSRFVTRDQAAELTGVQPAYGVPTGAIALGLKLFDKLPAPWFDYRYTDTEKTEAGSEDFTFSESCNKHGIPVFVSWDHWADHLKIERVGKPQKRMPAIDGRAPTGDLWEHTIDLVNFNMDAVKASIEKREPDGWRVQTFCAVPVTYPQVMGADGKMTSLPPTMAFSIIYARPKQLR